MLLQLENIGKSYGAVQALHGVSFSVAPGEIVGLMGDNGAGKSTLVKIIAGVFPPTEGTMRFGDETVHFHTPSQARGVGVRESPMDESGAGAFAFVAGVRAEGLEDWGGGGS